MAIPLAKRELQCVYSEPVSIDGSGQDLSLKQEGMCVGTEQSKCWNSQRAG